MYVQICARVYRRPLISHHKHLPYPLSRPSFGLRYPFLGKLGENNKPIRGWSPSDHRPCQETIQGLQEARYVWASTQLAQKQITKYRNRGQHLKGGMVCK